MDAKRQCRPARGVRASASGTHLAPERTEGVRARWTERAGRRRNDLDPGTSRKRLKGLEPSTFCMASRPRSIDGPDFSLQSGLKDGSRPTGSVPDFASFRRGSVHQLSTENRGRQASRASSALPVCLGYEQSVPRCCPNTDVGAGRTPIARRRTLAARPQRARLTLLQDALSSAPARPSHIRVAAGSATLCPMTEAL
jgi:hypothetical protein